MSLQRQIRLVLWKNFTIRRRKWPRVLFELIWPLFLFFILIWVRTRNLTFYYDACYNDPKYLGSTGFLPAFQSYLCRWNNTCYNQSKTDDNLFLNEWRKVSESLSIIFNDDESFNQLKLLVNQTTSFNIDVNIWNGLILTNQSTLVNLTNLHQTWFMNKTNNQTSSFDVLREIYEKNSYEYQTDFDIQQAFCWKGEFSRTFLIVNQTRDLFCQNLSSIELKSFLIDLQKQLDRQLQSETAAIVSDWLINGYEMVQTVERLTNRFEILNISLSFNFTDISFCDGRNDLSRYFVSNTSSTEQQPRISKKAARASTTEQTLIDYDWNSLATDLLSFDENQICGVYYSTGSGNLIRFVRVNRACRCVLFDQVFNSHPVLQQFARFIRPILYGKIAYYPSNDQYDRIIKQINQTFESLDEFVKLSRQLDRFIRQYQDRIRWICQFLSNSTDICNQTNTTQNSIDLFTILTEFVACSERNRFVPMANENDLVALGQNQSVTNTFLAGIVFLDEIHGNESLPKHVKFKIRMALDYVDNTFRTEDRYFSYAPRTTAPISTKYHSYTFIYLQNALERAILQAHTGRTLSYGIQTQQMPYPCWIEDKFVNSIRTMLPLFMVLSWIFTVSMNVKDIVYEKEKRLKEVMRIMGLKDSVHWLTWFILCTVVMMFIAFLLVIIIKFGKVTQFSNWAILMIFFLAYTFATITQCFLLSVFFNRANLAACGAGIIFFVLYLPYTILINYDTQTKTWHKILASLSSTVAFGLGCDYIARFEGMAQGIQWSNINQGARPNDNFTFANCILMMFFDSIIYMLLTVYIENLFPGEYGIAQVWYYPFTKTYWFGYDMSHKKDRERNETMELNHIGIEIVGLSKYFGNKLALKNLSVRFNRNMITGFLGRNGAGKSTTWAILTGLIPPSDGTIYIDGYDILTDMKIIRTKLGFAPQYNILFDYLTVKEHLRFFAQLKNESNDVIESDIEQMLHDLLLEKKGDNYSSELSGGMKRKLSIGIAFIGNSSTVILDEPTAGVDPYSRRAIWDLILKYKSNRTIVLSTHHLDEADLLSDEIAIISSGELQCIGTTMFLKRKYGEGYNLIIEMNSDENQFNRLTDFLRKFMFDIQVKEQHGEQIIYLIRDDIEHTRIFPMMLAELDENKDKFAIKTYGLVNCSLEQVFLRVADEVKRPEDYEKMSKWKRFRRPKILHNETVPENIDQTGRISDDWTTYTVERHTGYRRILMQIYALLIKRFHRTKRNLKGLVAELFLPIIFVLLAMLVTKLAPDQTDPPPLILHPWYWGKPNAMFQSYSPSNTSLNSKFTHQTFTKYPSLGTRCIKTSLLNSKTYPCKTTNVTHVENPTNSDVLNALNQVNYNRTRISPQCNCWQTMQTCPIGAGGPQANFDVLQTNDILYDLNQFNVTDWLIKSEFNREFLMKRFGGFEFVSNNSIDPIQLIDEGVLNRIVNLVNQYSLSINTSKLLPLFAMHPPQISIWYNNKGWPSSVAFLNLFNNALLRGVLLQQNSSIDLDEYGITAINHPLPQSQIQIDSELQTRATMELFTAICVIFALAFIPASFLVFLIDERTTTSKHLQFVSGIHGITYWCGNFLWDLFNYCLSISFCLIIFVSFNIEAYVSSMNLLCLILLLFLYGFAIIPLMYPINYIFQIPSTGFVLISCINIFIGLITTISTYLLESFDDQPDLERIGDILKKVFLIFPHYCLGRGLFDMSRIYATNMINSKYINGFVPVSPFQMDIVGRNFVALTFQGLVFFLLTILIQYRFFLRSFHYVNRIHPSEIQRSTSEDDDVLAERERIHSDPENNQNDILRMVDLVKTYGSIFGKSFRAVKQVCVGVKSGECFGLLGINGSGKSTTFKMLTGEIPMTDGYAYINNFNVSKQLNQIRQNIGYCPQFDALDCLLTAREHLYFYGRLRGLKEKNLPFIVGCLLKRLGLTLWADRPVGQYSGGNKRKLSTAISLMGNPSIIFMDEPTTGMDVRAKRFLWDCILTLTRQEKKSVIITSHSMEECETLCNRLVIMVNGEFKCLGSVQHLKQKFGDGYTILVRINIDVNRQILIEYIQKLLPDIIIKEEHNKMIHFRVATNIHLYKIFGILEKARDDLKDFIEDYTVSQVTLDDVFVNFAKIQQDKELE